MTNLNSAKRVIMEWLKPGECTPMLILVVDVQRRLGCTSDEARLVVIVALRELCAARAAVQMGEGFRGMDAQAPPYVFPDRKPTKYDATARGEVWVVCGSIYTDGTGWRWDTTQADELVPGDIWVPIHLLHSEPIATIVKRSLDLQKKLPARCEYCKRDAVMPVGGMLMCSEHQAQFADPEQSNPEQSHEGWSAYVRASERRKAILAGR